MKKIACICHDIGGYDVISPIFEYLKTAGHDCVFFALGPSAQLYGDNVSEEEALFEIKQLLDRYELGMLVTGTSWGTDIEVKCIELCNAKNVTTVAVLDYWSNYKMRFYSKDNKKCVFPKKFFVMDEIAYKEAMADGIDRNILEITGSPGLDKYIKRVGLWPSEVPTDDVLFLSQPLSELYGYDLGYTEQSAFADVLEVCQDLGRDVKIKFHPKDNCKIRDKFSSYAVCGNLDEVVPHFKVVIGMATMGLLHAHLLGKPIISYQPGLIGKDMCITNILGLSERVDSRANLKNILSQRIVPPRRGMSLIWEDGQSTERVVKRLSDLMEE